MNTFQAASSVSCQVDLQHLAANLNFFRNLSLLILLKY